MPGSGGPNYDTSHPALVYFGDVAIGKLTGFRLLLGTAQFEETTNITSLVIGSGANARLVKSYDCTSVEPGGVDLTLFGCPPFSVVDLGVQGTLYITFSGGSVSLDAFLESADVTAAVGDMLVGTVRFRFSGKNEE